MRNSIQINFKPIRISICHVKIFKMADNYQQHVQQHQQLSALLRFQQYQETQRTRSEECQSRVSTEQHDTYENEEHNDYDEEGEDNYFAESLNIMNSLRASSTASPQNTGSTNTVVTERFAYDVEIFIEEMKNYACIWNTSTRSHHDKNMRNVAWEELSLKFEKNGR